jgi:selenocysteine lyase/cysteine desulfurase
MGAGEAFDFDATSMRFAPDARRFTQSTMSYVSVAGLTASLERLLTAGLETIEEHADGLRRRLIGQAASRGRVPFRRDGDPGASPHIVALGHPDHRAGPVVAALRESGVFCSSRLDRVRVSLAPYNDDGDIDALKAALP